MKGGFALCSGAFIVLPFFLESTILDAKEFLNQCCCFLASRCVFFTVVLIFISFPIVNQWGAAKHSPHTRYSQEAAETGDRVLAECHFCSIVSLFQLSEVGLL